MKTRIVIASVVSTVFILRSALAFEGGITVTIKQGDQASGLLYTVSTNQLRSEKTDIEWPHARNIVDLPTGALTQVSVPSLGL